MCNLIFRRDTLEWLDNKFYYSLYSNDDEFITIVEDIKTLSNVFKMPLKEVLRKLRNNSQFILNGKLINVYPEEKFIIDENFRRII